MAAEQDQQQAVLAVIAAVERHTYGLRASVRTALASGLSEAAVAELVGVNMTMLRRLRQAWGQ